MKFKIQVISCRGAIGHGKSTAAKHLATFPGIRRVAFADALKLEVYEALSGLRFMSTFADWLWRGDQGPQDKAERVWESILTGRGLLKYRTSDADRIKEIDRIKETIRPVLQVWGTEYRRGQNENYWSDQWVKKVENFQAQGMSAVVVDDARFQNEFDAIKQFNSHELYITRPGVPVERNHASEALVDYVDPHAIYVSNQQTIEKFHSMVELVYLNLERFN